MLAGIGSSLSAALQIFWSANSTYVMLIDGYLPCGMDMELYAGCVLYSLRVFVRRCILNKYFGAPSYALSTMACYVAVCPVAMEFSKLQPA